MASVSNSDLITFLAFIAIALLVFVFGSYKLNAPRRRLAPAGEDAPEVSSLKGAVATPETRPPSNGDIELPGAPNRVRAAANFWEQRRWLRRAGNPVPLEICHPDPQAKPFTAMVLDRSRGGLCLLLPCPLNVGTTLKVRGTQNANAPWIEIEVRHCSSQERQWKVGCKFKTTLSQNTLEQFG